MRHTKLLAGLSTITERDCIEASAISRRRIASVVYLQRFTLCAIASLKKPQNAESKHRNNRLQWQADRRDDECLVGG